jgi:hypothetical protein
MHEIDLSSLNKISLLKLRDKYRAYGYSPRYDIHHTLPLSAKECVWVIFIPHLMVIVYTFKIINLFYFTKVRVLFRVCLGGVHVLILRRCLMARLWL